MQYIIGYTVEERYLGVTRPGAAEIWTLEELCDMGMSRTVECALDRMDGPASTPTTPEPIMMMGDTDYRVTAHRVLPIV